MPFGNPIKDKGFPDEGQLFSQRVTFSGLLQIFLLQHPRTGAKPRSPKDAGVAQG